MARNGSGTYSLPSGNPVVTGSVISSTTHNTTMSDIATALTASLAKDGQTTPSANLPMGTYRHTGVGNALARDQYASVAQVQDGSLVTLSTVSGTNTITATAPLSMSAYASGQCFRFVASAANTNAVTININSIGAKSITKDGTTALVAGDIQSGAVCDVVYDGTRFQLINPANRLEVDLADTASATKGAGLVGWSSALTYDPDTIGDGLNDVTVAVNAIVTRERLSGNRTYYVRTDGSDSNTGLADSVGGAFLTIQKAVNVTLNTIDLNGYMVTIQVRDGTYTGGVVIDRQPTGRGLFVILGNQTTPANCVISTTSADAVYVEQAKVFVRGFKLRTTTFGKGLTAYSGATIASMDMDFGACAGAHIEAGTGGTVLMDGAYTISAGAESHWHVGSEGMISVSTIPITVTGAPAWSAYFVGVAEGSVSCPNVTFSSTAGTGIFFVAHKNGTIDIGANNVNTFFPGNASGMCNTGGQIVTTNRSWTPGLSFQTPGNLSVAYSKQVGTWSREGDTTFITCELVTSTFTHTTASGNLTISGLPFTSAGESDVYSVGPLVFSGISKTGWTQFAPFIVNGGTIISIMASGSALPIANVTASDMPTGGTVTIRFSMTFRTQHN